MRSKLFVPGARPELFAKVIDHSTMLPFNQWKGIPGWFVGAAYKF